jgi:hypothetical protein
VKKRLEGPGTRGQIAGDKIAGVTGVHGVSWAGGYPDRRQKPIVCLTDVA